MANKKFTDFDLAASLVDGDYIIGYKANATAELRTTFETFRNSLPAEFKYQGADLKALSANWQSTFTTVQSASATWNEAYTLIQANSATWETDSSGDLEVRALSANWEGTFNTVQSNSATNWDNSLANNYADSKFLPLSGGDLTGAISLSNVQVEQGTTLTDSLSSLVITINGQQYKIPLLAV
jgi:hypothetical protein